MNLPRSAARRLLAAGLLATAGAAAALDKGDCGLILLHEAAAAPAAVARRLGPACTVKPLELAAGAERELPALWRELRRRMQELRQQGAQKVLVGGWGLGANVAMAYGAQVGEADGVLVIAPEEQVSGLGSLPELAGKLRQHAPVLWVIGSEDPRAKRGEDYAYAKAPPHPASRFVRVKADRRGTPEAAAKPVAEWIKQLD